MAEEGKKISFGFAKSIKKPALKNLAPPEPKKVDYIECLDGKAIKVIGGEEKKEELLVIPLLGSKTWHDRILNKVDADIFEPKVTTGDVTENTKKEVEPDISNGNSSPAVEIVQPVRVKIEPGIDNESSLSLEQQAAKEIIEDLRTEDEQVTVKKELLLPLTEEETLRGKNESTLEDYERIPIDAFGLAMLRGMGWKPGKGIGKNEKIVPAVLPELRPKGMGLGADKLALQKKPSEAKKQEEELKIEKGTFVKFIAGKQSNSYGQIEGLDDDAGRLIIKLALGGQSVSVNEFMVQPVTKSEYNKNSKVLNAKKFEEFKEKQATGKKEPLSSEESESSEDDKRNRRKESKKSNRHREDEREVKTRKRHSSESSNSSDYKKRTRHRSRSSSPGSHRTKKVKKSKKHKKHDSSPSRKSKKKDKERERTRDKKSRDTEHRDQRKHKKHRRSRSRS